MTSHFSGLAPKTSYTVPQVHVLDSWPMNNCVEQTPLAHTPELPTSQCTVI
jgi:hypothetical protein